ncbi:MAG: large conductance mechanosensitive channel protein MscL [Anaerolineae bacterium]|nr:large conductance mechanosensitive channel protein MscL [Anaerolineae bacterium]
MWKELKAFILRGNVIDLAVGVIMGGVFNTVIKSLVSDVIMPPIGLLLGRVNFADLFLMLKKGDPVGPYATLADAQAAGAVVISYGVFVNNVVTLILTGIAVFFVVKAINRLNREKPAPPAEPTTKLCPYCLSTIPIKATRCPNCTSQLEEK